MVNADNSDANAPLQAIGADPAVILGGGGIVIIRYPI
jgi:hypothetical protein